MTCEGFASTRLLLDFSLMKQSCHRQSRPLLLLKFVLTRGTEMLYFYIDCKFNLKGHNNSLPHTYVSQFRVHFMFIFVKITSTLGYNLSCNVMPSIKAQLLFFCRKNTHITTKYFRKCCALHSCFQSFSLPSWAKVLEIIALLRMVSMLQAAGRGWIASGRI